MFKKEKQSIFLNNQNSFSELKKRFFFLIFSLIVFRIGTFIPIPGIETDILIKLLEKQKGTIIEMLNVFSGGSLSRASIFTLGIMPYISASIIIQLLTVIHPKLSDLKKEGESGSKKINQYTRYTTLFLAVFQSLGISIGIPNIPGTQGLIIKPDLLFYFTAIISLVTGTIFLMWLGEQITEKGIGNGISIIIFSGIMSGLPVSAEYTIEETRQGNLHFLFLILILFFIFLITFFVVFIERSQRKILVHYVKRQQIYHRMNVVQNTSHLPLKINMAGVIPAIFASSVVLFPTTMLSWFGSNVKWSWLNYIFLNLQPGKIFYVLLYASAIIFFCFFYTSLIFNPRETADNLKKSGAFLPGIRPGEQTAEYINKIMLRLNFLGAFYITIICLIPEIMRELIKVPFYFGGTSLLIVVVVIIDFISQIQTIIMSGQYESVLRKANLKIKKK